MDDESLVTTLPKNLGDKLSEQLMLQQGLALVLEKIINNALRLNINDNSTLAFLESKQLTVELDELTFPLSFHIYDQQIIVNSLTESSDCIITTSLSTLKELKQHQKLTELIKQDKLDIVGDLKLAQQFANVAQNLKIDWQSEIAKHIGDFTTYKLGRVAKSLVNKFKFLTQQIQADSGEWLVHETKLVLTKNQLDDFNLQVTQVSEQTTQLARRLAALDKRILS